MRSNSEFWLTIHKLASDLSKEGATDKERAENVCKILSSLAPAARAFYILNLTEVASALSLIATQCKTEM